jgi:hypothetical protein
MVHIARSNGKGCCPQNDTHPVKTLQNWPLCLTSHLFLSGTHPINGTPMSEQQVVHRLSKIFDICNKEGKHATFLLGDMLEQIAREKCRIIKEGCPL